MPGNRKKEYDPKLVAEWAALYENGMSQEDLRAYESARGRHTSWENIKRELEKVGVKFRSFAEQNQLGIKRRKEYYKKIRDSLTNE